MKNKSNRTWVWLFVLLLAVTAFGATAYALMTPGADDMGERTSQSAEEMGMTEEEHANMDSRSKIESNGQGEQVITFTNAGFDKASYIFSQGPVTVRNESSMNLQFSSDDHPSHRDHAELNMNVLTPGESGRFTPPGAGSYGFHDHINDQFEGTLTIE